MAKKLPPGEGEDPEEQDFEKAFLDRLNDPQFLEASFREIAESGLRGLEGLDDSQQVVLDDFPAEGKVYTVAEVKHIIATIRDKDNPFTHGLAIPIIVISTNPEEYFREIQEETDRRKQFALKELEPYSDDQLLTYVHPNHFTDPFTGKAQYHQRTAKELRDWINAMDYEEADQVLSHMGGIKVISADPNISMEELADRTEANNRVFGSLLQEVIDRVNQEAALRERLIADIQDLPDDAYISYPLGDGSHLPELSVRELKARLGIRSKSPDQL